MAKAILLLLSVSARPNGLRQGIQRTVKNLTKHLIPGLCAAALWGPLNGAAVITNINVAADTFIISGTSDYNAGATGWLDAGRDGNANVRRGLFRFNLSGIPAGSAITSAVVRLTVTKVPGFGPVNSAFNLHRLKADWTEGAKSGFNGAPATAGEATWNARLHTVANWSAPGAAGDAEGTPSASVQVGAAANATYAWSGPSLIADVQSWVDNPSQNFGWLLKSEAEGSARSVRGFASREDGASAGTLQVGYTPPNPPQVITDPIPDSIAKGGITIELKTVLDGLPSPLGMAVPDDGTGRLLICDQSGLIWVLTPGGKLPAPLLDVRGRLVNLGAYDERGLLGLAAHRNFAQYPFIYTYTSEPNAGAADFPSTLPVGKTNNHQSVVAEWRIDPANTNRVDPASRRELLRIDEPQSNHNGGALHFGPDGYLYITTGDGGQSNDVGDGHAPGGNAQNLATALGKLLRIDVDGTAAANGQYSIPNDNPFTGPSALPEIYAYGFRNPFSFSFDRLTGQIYLGDVGQNNIEEVDLVVKGGNYGWNLKEGSFWFDPANGTVVTSPVRPAPAGLIDPIAEYDHNEGTVVIGGFVYRGSLLPALRGRYVFAEWGTFSAPSGKLWYLDDGNVIKQLRIGLEDRSLGLWVKGLGQDAEGELYVFGTRALGPGGNTGGMLKLVPAPQPVEMTQAPTGGTGSFSPDWSGGAGPFVLQRKTTFAEPIWMDAGASSSPKLDVPALGKTGFFRVVDAGHLPAVPLTLHLSGAFERPNPVTTTGAGGGLMRLEGSTLTFNISYSNLSASAVAAHIHGPAPASGSAGVMLDLAPYHIGSFGAAGAFAGVAVLTEAQQTAILGGKAYVNIHTGNNPGGEIRGQIAPVLMLATLNGANESINGVATSGTGLGVLTLVGDQLTLNVTYRNLSASATAAHIHGPAGLFENTGVMVSLAPLNGWGFGIGGTLSGAVKLSAAQLAAVVDGLTYVNIHTANNPGGEIRGQIAPHVTGVPLTALLGGAAEQPAPVATAAAGAGIFSLDGRALSFSLVYSNLSAPAFAAHIHGPAPASQNGPVLIDLAPLNGGAFGTNGTIAGTVVLTEAQKNYVLAGQTYVNFHTANYTGGEMRGQICPVLVSASLSGANERPEGIATTGAGGGTFALVFNQLSFQVGYSGLTGSATATHIHGAASAFQTAGVLVDLGAYANGGLGASGGLAGAVFLTPAQLGLVIDGLTYVNFHTPNNGAGEIRGQLAR